MITRTYVVRMPGEESPTTPVDILVENDPGAQDAPVGDETTGAYYEQLGRPLSIPNPASNASSYIPRLRLGFVLSLTPIAGAALTAIPSVQLSESLAQLASTDAGPTIDVPSFPDPSDQPAIRLTGSAATQGRYFVLSLSIVEPADTDRSGTGVR